MRPPVIETNSAGAGQPAVSLATAEKSSTWSKAGLGPIGLFAAGAGLLGLLRLAERFELPWPRCGLRTLTGWPCPMCGSTRCLTAWAHGEIAPAFQFNPLVALGALAFGVWFLVWLSDQWTCQDRAMRVWRRLGRRPWPAVLIGAVFANWCYLVIWLPK